MENKAGGSKVKRHIDLSSLARKRDCAREELNKFIGEHQIEWQVSRKLLKKYENRFVKIWKKHSEKYYQNQEFFRCGEELCECIIAEQTSHRYFRNLYKPYYENLQNLDKEYAFLQKQQSKKQEKQS